MSKKLYEESSIQAIADAIRTKNGTQSTYKTSQMPNAILNINPEPDLETLSVSQNGNYLPSSGKDGFSSVSVAVPNTFAVGDEGKVVKNGALVAQTSRNISANGTYDTTENNSVIVNVSGGGGGGGEGLIRYGTSTPGSSIGNDEDLYIQYNIKDSTVFDHTYSIIEIFRKVNGAWQQYVDPMPINIVIHVWTKSIGGSDASMYVQLGHWDDDQNVFVADGEAESVIYSSVPSGNTKNCYGLASLGYYGGSWRLTALTDVTDGTTVYTENQLIASWSFQLQKDLYIRRSEIT